MTEWTNRMLLEILKMAATPIDFDQLIADGVPRKHGARYELLDLAPFQSMRDGKYASPRLPGRHRIPWFRSISRASKCFEKRRREG